MSDELCAPLMSTIDITNYCNLKCAYCYAHNNKTIFMKKDKVIETVFELRFSEVWQIVISGGEPFLHPDIIPILKSILTHEVDLSLTTNGTVLSESQVQQIRRFQQEFPNRLTLQVSIDGPTTKINDILRGEGKKLFYNLELLVKNCILFGIGTVLHRYNTDYIQDLLEMFYPVVTNFHFLSLMPSHSVTKNATELYPT